MSQLSNPWVRGAGAPPPPPLFFLDYPTRKKKVLAFFPKEKLEEL